MSLPLPFYGEVTMSVSNRIKRGVVTDAAAVYPQRMSSQQKKLFEAVKYDTNIEENFDSQLCVSSVDKEGALLATSTPAAGDEIVMYSRKNPFEMHVMSINGTPVHSFPFVSADGLELNVDDDATNGITGIEISNGIVTNCSAALTVGTDHDIFFEAVVKIDDISDVTELWMGLRKAEAYQVDPDNYDEMCAYNVGKDADGQIEIHTILNNGATSETDTTEADWADGNEKTLLIKVDKNGLCSFQIDGSEPAVVPSFSFDSGEVIVPFVALTAETGDPGVSISSWKAGKY